MSWEKPHLDYAHTGRIEDVRRQIEENWARFARLRKSIEHGEQATREMEEVLIERMRAERARSS